MKKPVDFYEIYDYYYQPVWERSSFKLTFISFVAILIGVIIFFIIKYFLRKRREKSLLPWEWALKELNRLELEKCSNKKEYKIFYFDLTDIIKKYLNKRYSWDTQDKTDEELLVYLQDKKFDPVVLEKLSSLVDGALWVKFADEDALRIQIDKDLNGF